MLMSAGAFAQGREVDIILKSGTAQRAELISVRSNGVLIAKDAGLSEERLKEDLTRVEMLPAQDIQSITIEGHSYVLVGLGWGFFAGVVVGGLIGGSGEAENEMDEAFKGLEVISGAAVGGLCGLVLGTVAGAATSQSDQVIEPTSPALLLSLQRFSRYPDGEPEYLNAIQ